MSKLLSTICVLIISTTTANASLIVPSGLSVGDTYQLIFITSNIRDATSKNIDDYNSFVQTSADIAGIGSSEELTWHAVVSTNTVDAIDNAVLFGSLYGMTGDLIANDTTDLWDGSIASPILYNEHGANISGSVWSGTLPSGLKGTYPLGSTLASYGRGDITDSRWIINGGLPQSITLDHFFAISDVITVSAVPIPPAVWLFGSGLIGLIRFARRKV